MSDGRFRAHVVRPESPEPHVTLPIVKGGEYVDNAQHDCALMVPFDGRYEDVEMRVFGGGVTIKFRFNAQTMREALEMTKELRA